ncbi:protein eva-1 homolog C-like isoform X2 [Megalops cyprinoides]|uniref:protein eva-1 homolog C-like isoform X2 n=1 Tax=Megalops cyprinoides TaxID=118141 RepID=UPI001863F582|nr:protein eva-1 homolog C-like isoform X2 [Megalops cyprinoides]
MLVEQCWSRSSCFLSLCLCLALSAHLIQAAPDFTAYLHKILRNHSAQACDGEMLTVTCPSKTAIAVLSVFYGRRTASQNVCPATDRNSTEESAECVSFGAVQKVTYKCQDRRACQIPVTSGVFGPDPCPGTSKYLIVSYKCRPEHHRSKLVCENEKLRLTCKNDTVLAIYSATFGHLLHGSPDCPQENTTAPDIECLSPSALRRVTRRCHGKTNCSLLADTQSFGDPCFPGVRKQLRVSYTCVPRHLLEDLGRGSSDPFLITDYTHVFPPTQIMSLPSGFPEAVALYFVSGICAGLVFLLCLFGLKSTLVRDVKDLFSEADDDMRGPCSEPTEDDTASDSSFRRLTRCYRVANMFSPERMVDTEEEMEEEPKGDIWLHTDSSPFAIHNIKATA